MEVISLYSVRRSCTQSQKHKGSLQSLHDACYGPGGKAGGKASGLPSRRVSIAVVA